MSDKPDWDEAPEWAKHLWEQRCDGRFCWSASVRENSKALWSTDVDNSHNRFHLWVNCWEYVEARPK